MRNRRSGILLHITSLPSSFGIGDLGPVARQFAELLKENMQTYWQILPLNPTALDSGNSPYMSTSAFAGNTLLINLDHLSEEGLLKEEEIETHRGLPDKRIDYPSAIALKNRLLNVAYQRFKELRSKKESDHFDRFCLDNANWLDDFALFSAIKSHYKGNEWIKWPRKIRNRDEKAIGEIADKLYDPLQKEKYLQYIFFKQWYSLKDYCNKIGIKIIGDMPYYISYDSADVWSHSDLFNLDKDKMPLFRSGVPPDRINKNGQLWGTPTYKWNMLKRDDYSWWKRRIRHNLNLFDALRIDHFRGFIAYWAIPEKKKNSRYGKWIRGPAKHFFTAMNFQRLPIIVEDLGFITPAVRETMASLDLTGMRTILLAFGEDFPKNEFVPHNLVRNCIVYTGTHDFNTAKGWFESEASHKEKMRLFKYLGREADAEEISWEFIRLAMASVANTAILPMQDVLSLGKEARMNIPGLSKGNWEWRALPEQIRSLDRRLADMTKIYGRV